MSNKKEVDMQRALVSALFFPLQSKEGIVLASGVFYSQDELVQACLHKLNALPSGIFTNAHIVVEHFKKARLEFNEERPGRIVRHWESLYDLLMLETDRFFDVPR